MLGGVTDNAIFISLVYSLLPKDLTNQNLFILLTILGEIRVASFVFNRDFEEI